MARLAQLDRGQPFLEDAYGAYSADEQWNAAVRDLLGLAPMASCAERFRVLAMGQLYPSYSPILGFFNSEPSIQGTLVICPSIHTGIHTDEELGRLIRLYMPRTCEISLGTTSSSTISRLPPTSPKSRRAGCTRRSRKRESGH